MANIKSAIKRNRQNEKRALANKGVRSQMRTYTKKALESAGTDEERREPSPCHQAHRQGRKQGHHSSQYRCPQEVTPFQGRGRCRRGVATQQSPTRLAESPESSAIVAAICAHPPTTTDSQNREPGELISPGPSIQMPVPSERDRQRIHESDISGLADVQDRSQPVLFRRAPDLKNGCSKRDDDPHSLLHGLLDRIRTAFDAQERGRVSFTADRRAVERRHAAVVRCQAGQDGKCVALATVHHAPTRAQRRGYVAARDRVGEIPRRHIAGATEEGLELVDPDLDTGAMGGQQLGQPPWLTRHRNGVGGGNAATLQQLTHRVCESAGAFYVVGSEHPGSGHDANDMCTVGCAASVAHRVTGDMAEEAFVGCAQKRWVAQFGQLTGGEEQVGGHGGVLAKIECGVDHDSLARNASGLGPRSTLGQKAQHVGHDVVIDRVGIGQTRRGTHVACDHRGARFGCSEEVERVGETAGVVANRCSGLETGLCDLRPKGVHRDRHVEAGRERFDSGHNSFEFFLDTYFVAGFESDTPDIKEVSSLGHQRFGLGKKVVKREVLATVEERVGRAVQDPHDQSPGRYVEGVSSQL
ncbi:30S ribosomal protein S20 [Nymphon striatum]|nr:30S ribosomal protein S20 [Nymphon striatum]